MSELQDLKDRKKELEDKISQELTDLQEKYGVEIDYIGVFKHAGNYNPQGRSEKPKTVIKLNIKL